jgi:protein-tyrosine phosphatase
MFPKSLQRLIESFSTQDIAQAIVSYLPQESIISLVSMQVPAPLQLQKKSGEKVLNVSIDPSFYNSLLFTEYNQIPKNDPNFSYMDPTFAIGNANSSYSPFNIIVNLDFPYNGVEKNRILAEMTSDKKLIIRVGIYDLPEEPMAEVIDTLVPFLNTLVKYHYNQPRILFHCKAGISRSASVALAYYGKIMKYDLTRAYTQLAARRAIIRPNPGFIEAIEEFLI